MPTYVVKRTRRQNSLNDDAELSPRAPLSPRGSVPAAPYMTPGTPRGDGVAKPRTSPRFGPRDENHEKPPSQNGRLAPGKRGPALSARSSSASKIRTALREHSTSSVRHTTRERRPNPLLGNSPPTRTAPTTAPQAASPSKANQSRTSCGSASSSSRSSEHSGPSLGENGALRSAAVTPSTSTTSLIVPYAGHRPVPAGATTAAGFTPGEELRRMSCYSGHGDPGGSARSYAEGHPHRSSSCPLSTTGSEDFQGLSQGGPLPPVDADGEVPNWGSEQVELLCQKAQSLVRQMGAQALGFDTSRPPSARSSPCIKVSPPQASPCTPTPHRAGPGLNFSPGPRVLPDITNLSREDVADFRHRLSQVEQALHLGQAPNSEVLKLRGRMQTVESELVDVRAELREVRAAVSRLSEKMDVPEPLGTPGLIRTMPSSKQPVRLPCNQCQTVPQQVPQQMPQQVPQQAPPSIDQAPVLASPRKLPPRAPSSAAPFTPLQQTRGPGLASPMCLLRTLNGPQVGTPPQTVRVHPSLRPPNGASLGVQSEVSLVVNPMPIPLGQWRMTPA
ncbi:unnamed protein product [Durusdinium trenchii]|uniref:Uncharacterized protein n=1 Tax=Durusdinium trenchii TaxID=1381693 RepID=A0ABP0QTB0_9DINO